MMPTITQLSGREILDSRGRPTVEARCELSGGAVGIASVPSGASTGSAEALELRDGDPRRYRGLGCRRAASHIGGAIHAALAGQPVANQAALDDALLALDGTTDKSRLGANALLAVSLAFARAVAIERGVPLYQQFAEIFAEREGDQPSPSHLLGPSPRPRSLPRLTINLFSGGKHAGGQVPIQDVLLVPTARTIDEGLAAVFAVYQAAAELASAKYGMRALSADEGGLAPPFADAETMLADAVAAIQAAGLEPGREVALAVDVASSHFYRDDRYALGDELLESAAMIARLGEWVERYPIVSVEDGLAEDDWEHWPALRERLAGRALTLGDDLLCTNPGRIRRAIESQAADALLLKVNQIGTLSEAAEACRLARGAGWRVTISARSGETEDSWLADLAVGWGGDQIKVGSITQSERLAKYNRLLAIEAETGLPVIEWPS
ncbi:MAG TPA: enolase C-terminal domain-like protein [Roseiflexaceae bacterium]|nr:enolase C-terminal domain-like protein [Roseiflexaceae bacterium]